MSSDKFDLEPKKTLFLEILVWIKQKYRPFLTSEEIDSQEIENLSVHNTKAWKEIEFKGDHSKRFATRKNKYTNTIEMLQEIYNYVYEIINVLEDTKQMQFELINILFDFATFLKPATIVILLAFLSPLYSLSSLPRRIEIIHFHLSLVLYRREKNKVEISYYKHKTPQEFNIECRFRHEEIFNSIEIMPIDVFRFLEEYSTDNIDKKLDDYRQSFETHNIFGFLNRGMYYII